MAHTVRVQVKNIKEYKWIKTIYQHKGALSLEKWVQQM
jgi:hypothetical protein